MWVAAQFQSKSSSPPAIHRRRVAALFFHIPDVGEAFGAQQFLGDVLLDRRKLRADHGVRIP
jgi:hypothetical protein